MRHRGSSSSLTLTCAKGQHWGPLQCTHAKARRLCNETLIDTQQSWLSSHLDFNCSKWKYVEACNALPVGPPVFLTVPPGHAGPGSSAAVAEQNARSSPVRSCLKCSLQPGLRRLIFSLSTLRWAFLSVPGLPPPPRGPVAGHYCKQNGGVRPQRRGLDERVTQRGPAATSEGDP